MTAHFTFVRGRDLDLICLGRLAVDLYAEQLGASLEAARSFAMYLGGSSANLAFGVARLGLKSAMISRVGDEQMGRFLINTLQREGCDVSQIQIDKERLTGAVLLGIKDQATFPLLFLRENCADMAIEADTISEAFIARGRALAITGTHLSTDTTLAAVKRALGYAKAHGLVRVLDIDYRPVLWGLTGRGGGENRYVADAQVSARLQQILPQFDVLVGTEEEFLIAGGEVGLVPSLKRVRALCPGATLVVKRGALGCVVLEGGVPDLLEEAPCFVGEKVEVLNVLGAGDAFLAGLLTSLLRGEGWGEATRIANACGALVVSRHACSAAMPTAAELAHWFAPHSRARQTMRPDQDPVLAHLHRVTVPRRQWHEVFTFAFDHRSQFYDLAQRCGADPRRISQIKSLFVAAIAQIETDHERLRGHLGVLIDGGDMGGKALAAATGRGWWVGRPIELPGSRPLRFDGTGSPGTELRSWPGEQVVKCLVHYHPDEAVELRLAQEAAVLELWDAVAQTGHELLLEIIPPSNRSKAAQDRDAVVLRAIKRFYNLGVKPEWWKLAPMAPASWRALGKLINHYDPYCRGAVVLGLNLPLAELVASFRAAQDPVIKGFMVGRTVWMEPAALWLQNKLNDEALVAAVTTNILTLVDAWRDRKEKA